MGRSELLIREAIKGIPRDNVFISVKFGSLRDREGNFNGLDTRPVTLQNFLAYSLQCLANKSLSKECCRKSPSSSRLLEHEAVEDSHYHCKSLRSLLLALDTSQVKRFSQV